MTRLCWLCVWLLGCDVVLARGLSEERASTLAAALDRQGVAARAVREPSARAMRLEVAREAVPAAVTILVQEDRGEASQPPAEVEPSWLETRSQERMRRGRELAAELARTLERMPDVVEARVHIQLPAASAGLPEAQLAPAASALILRTQAASSHAAAARLLIAGAVPGLAPETVRVIETVRPAKVARPPQFAHVGPFAVASSSATGVRAGMIASLLLHMILASLLLAPALRRLWSRRGLV